MDPLEDRHWWRKRRYLRLVWTANDLDDEIVADGTVVDADASFVAGAAGTAAATTGHEEKSRA